MALEQRHDAGHAHPRAILAPGHAADGLAAIAQLVGLVIGIERQGESATCAVGRGLGLEPSSRPHLVHQPAPMGLGPLPGMQFLIHRAPLPHVCPWAARSRRAKAARPPRYRSWATRANRWS